MAEETQRQKKPGDSTRDMDGDIMKNTGLGFTTGTITGFIYHSIKAAASTAVNLKPSAGGAALVKAAAKAGLKAGRANSLRAGGLCALFAGLDLVAKAVVEERVVKRDLTYLDNVAVSTATAASMLVPRHGFRRAAVAAVPFAAGFSTLYADNYLDNLGRFLEFVSPTTRAPS